MIKTLILVRHSKAENRDSSIKDFNRSLTPEGKADSMKMANFLNDAGIIPDSIITSSATRAFETAMILADALKTDRKNFLPTKTLYYSSAKTILDQIYGLNEGIGCVLIVAHNPGISELTKGLSSGQVFYMDNTQVSILEYKMEHWYQIDDIKPIKFKSFSLKDIG